jgi:hypothetical protein
MLRLSVIMMPIRQFAVSVNRLNGCGHESPRNEEPELERGKRENRPIFSKNPLLLMSALELPLSTAFAEMDGINA